MAYVRGTQAPMDLTEPGPRQRALCTLTAASIFDAPMDTATPDASLMDLDPDSPAVEPPSSAPPVTVLGAPPPAERSIQPAPAIQEVGSDGGHLMLRPAPGSPHVRAPEPSEPVPLPKRTAPSVLERPELLLTYAQVLFNASIIFVFLYLLFSLVWTIQRDVSQKVREYELGTLTGLTQTTWVRLHRALPLMLRTVAVPKRKHLRCRSCASHGNGALHAIPPWWDAHALRQRRLPRSSTALWMPSAGRQCYFRYLLSRLWLARPTRPSPFSV